jgi:hypothetical protein
MKTPKTILTLLTLTTVICANGQSNLGQIPTKVKQTADSIINLTLGADYFNKTTFNCENSRIHVTNPDHFVFNDCRQPETIKKKKKKKKNNKKKVGTDLKADSYALKYKLALTPNSNYTFEIRIDQNLKLTREINLPNCINTNACDIKVDSLSAIDLAIKSGLEKGLGVNSKLIYDTESKAFQWEIQNHTQTKPDRGDTIYINTQTGQRISDKDEQWMRPVVR